MATWIALFRGINVGGSNSLPMAALRADLAALGLTNVRTYIQSGNAVFESPARSAASLTKAIGARIEDRHGFRPQLLLLRERDLLAAIEGNPFPAATSDPKTLHVFFLARRPSKPDMEALDDARAASESYELTDRVLYLHAPGGIARSKLAATAERHLGVVTTARNFRTVQKLAALAAGD